MFQSYIKSGKRFPSLLVVLLLLAYSVAGATIRQRSSDPTNWNHPKNKICHDYKSLPPERSTADCTKCCGDLTKNKNPNRTASVTCVNANAVNPEYNPDEHGGMGTR